VFPVRYELVLYIIILILFGIPEAERMLPQKHFEGVDLD
jgi:hypothetical protein